MPEYLFPVLIVVQVISALSIILLVLLQQGKGADMGSSFGGGSAGSLFGSAGSANFFSRLTKWVAMLFFVSTLGLAYVSSKTFESRNAAPTQSGSVMEGFAPVQSAPAVPPVDGTSTGTPSSAVPSAVPVAPAATTTPSAELDPALKVNSAPATESSTVPSAPETNANTTK